MKKIYLLLVMAVLGLNVSAQVWDGASAKPWTQGDGSENNPYQIESPEQLAYLSQRVAEKETFEGKFFKMVNNLDMGGKAFTPIGLFNEEQNSSTGETTDKSLYFKGIFDGNFKTIRNLLINKGTSQTTDETGTSYISVGLFACSHPSTVIRNVVLDTSSNIAVAGQYVGAFIGVMKGGLLENCMNLGSVSGQATVGGLVGFILQRSTIQYCANKGTVKAPGIETGGIAAHIEKDAVIRGCYNAGDITTDYYFTGGIAGTSYDTPTVTNCYNIGKVSGLSSPYISQPHAILGENDKNSAIVANNYYVKSLAGVDDVAGMDQTEEEMKSESILAKLNKDDANNPFVADKQNTNNGFPVLFWEQNTVTAINHTDAATNPRISHGTISSTKPVVVWNLAGQVIACGKNIHLDKKGIYLVGQQGKPAMKVMVK